LTGRLLGGLFHTDQQSLCVVIGVAAFLGAGYRVPLAAVMFVAEATGRPGFVVPGLIAATVAQLMMGDATVCPYQRKRRLGYLEERTRLPLAGLMDADPPTAHAGDALGACFGGEVALARRRAVSVVDADGTYEGLLLLTDVLAVPPGDWDRRTAGELARGDLPVARPDWSLGQALHAMVEADEDHIAVVDGDGHLVGLVSSDDLVDRTRIMEDLDIHG
jgi:CBS domain-containing protein